MIKLVCTEEEKKELIELLQFVKNYFKPKVGLKLSSGLVLYMAVCHYEAKKK